MFSVSVNLLLENPINLEAKPSVILLAIPDISHKVNMFRGWAYAFEGGGGNYSASPSLISVDRNGNYHISIVGGNGSNLSNYSQEFPDVYGSNIVNCTNNPYLINYTYNQSTDISMSNCSQISNITDMVYVNSTLVTSQAPVLSLAYDHNSGILYQFGMQTNTSSGCPQTICLIPLANQDFVFTAAIHL